MEDSAASSLLADERWGTVAGVPRRGDRSVGGRDPRAFARRKRASERASVPEKRRPVPFVALCASVAAKADGRRERRFVRRKQTASGGCGVGGTDGGREGTPLLRQTRARLGAARA